MCIRDRYVTHDSAHMTDADNGTKVVVAGVITHVRPHTSKACLLYTSDAADERSSVDLGGRRIIKKTRTTIDDDDVAIRIRHTTARDI